MGVSARRQTERTLPYRDQAPIPIEAPFEQIRYDRRDPRPHGRIDLGAVAGAVDRLKSWQAICPKRKCAHGSRA
jgi:hypothetical protein